MRTVSGIMLVMLLTGTLVLAFNVRRAESKPGTIIVPDDYPKIQDAIDNASAGDTIFVRAGTYNECITIDKPLTLKGESNQNTTLQLSGGSRGWGLFGLDIIASNVTVSGFTLIKDPRFYWPAVVLVDIDARSKECGNNTIKDNILMGRNTDALALLGSSGNKIMNNSISNNPSGCCIYMVDSSDSNFISYNELSGGWAGVYISFSSSNTVLGNDIANQKMMEPGVIGGNGAGIEIMHSPDNVVVGNRLTGNDVGVDVFAADSIDNSIYHNSFVGNVIQAGVYSSYNSWYSGYPSWDSGYPSGGNYWSDYNGSDLYGGPYQNVTGSDGIGDAPYIINALISTDHYPLMSPVKKIVGDVNMDGVVDGRDLIVVSRAFAATPACTNWNQLADLNGDGKIDGQDMIIVARHFGQHYL